jgi:hypothetical protein
MKGKKMEEKERTMKERPTGSIKIIQSEYD